MNIKKRRSLILMAALVAATSLFPHLSLAQAADEVAQRTADPFPPTYADPAVPLLQLPTNFRARRTTAKRHLTPGQPVEIFNATGSGCVRHMWFVFGDKNIEDLSIEITVDGAAEPQVRMPFRSFFGALLGFEDYHINSAGLANFPNFTVTNDVHIPPKASPGWNVYLPIPFSKGCRIVLRADSAKGEYGGMIDWQQYRDGVKLTPLRFHAQRNIAQPGKPARTVPDRRDRGHGLPRRLHHGLAAAGSQRHGVSQWRHAAADRWPDRSACDLRSQRRGRLRLLVGLQPVSDPLGRLPLPRQPRAHRSGWRFLPVLRPGPDPVPLLADFHLCRAAG